MAKRLNKENIVTLLRLIKSWINRKADKDALITGGVTKLGTSTVGSASKPIYWSEGEPKATSGTLDVSITGNAASATEASKAINADNATTAATANTATLSTSARRLAGISDKSFFESNAGVYFYAGQYNISSDIISETSTNVLEKLSYASPWIASLKSKLNLGVLRLIWANQYFSEFEIDPNFDGICFRTSQPYTDNPKWHRIAFTDSNLYHNGDGISIQVGTGANGDEYMVYNTGILSVSTSASNGKIKITKGNGDGTTTSSDVAVTGLKSLAYLDTVPIASSTTIGGVKLCSAGDTRLTLTTNTTSKRYLQVETSDDSKGLAYIEYPAWDGNTIKVSNNKLYVDTKSVVSLGTALSWSGNKINPTIGTMTIGTGVTALSTTYKNITKVTNGLADEQTVAAIADRLFELEKKVVAYLGTA